MITVDTEGMGITVMADMADTGGTMITVMAQATMAGKGTAGARASTGGSRRGTNRTEWRDQGHDYSAGSWNNGDAY